jgi:hypothetical protein
VTSLREVKAVSNDIELKPTVSATGVKDNIENALKRYAQIEAGDISVAACVFRSMWAPDSIRSGHQFLFDVGSNSVVMWAALFDSP